mgnify:CR=1 FL=1
MAFAVEVDRLQDLNTAETFWDIFNAGRGTSTYSGWGTGLPAVVQARPVYGAAIPYSSPTFGYGGVYSGYTGNVGGGYSSDGIFGNGLNYYAKIQVPIYTPPLQPTYENYALHGGHGFGKYGNNQN